ncbi:hypothetical protein [uncultured Algibacter sp.]|uniref:hypothetical protein n=1 Tax=uncultured Algibacter sp. TaxID=298659 RepID=UPI0026032CC1|nr:hypothetical protein [uncultured Algibacter sp.]
MKLKSIFLILVIFTFISCNEKENKTEINDNTIAESDVETIDTLKQKESEPKVIAPKGTQIFQNSEKLYDLDWGNGYILKSIEVTECDNSVDGKDDFALDKKVQNIIIKEDSFIISFKVVGNCCSKFLCEAELNNNTLNIIYQAFGSHCSCNCIFDMTYKFNFNESFDRINVERTEIKNIILNGDLESKTEFK